MIVLAVAALVAALVYPLLSLGRFQDEVDALQANVDLLRAEALEHLADAGDWPSDAEPGVVPPELVAALPPGYSFRSEAYSFDWNRWEVVDVPDAAPARPEVPLEDDEIEADTLSPSPASFSSLASLSVHAADDRVLAALLAHYGVATSFVQDTTWTLVMPRKAPGR